MLHAYYKNLEESYYARSQLVTKYLKTKTHANLKLFKKLKNVCSKLCKGGKRKYYESLDMKNVLDIREFWKTMKPFSSDKDSFSLISIEKKTRIISYDFNLSEEFSTRCQARSVLSK